MHLVPDSMISKKIDASLSVRADGQLVLSRNRITLLEAIMECKSITSGAEKAGFSYKTAWDAVHAINNFLPYPAFIKHVGGIQNGTQITDEGRRLINVFNELEKVLSQIFDTIAKNGLIDNNNFAFKEIIEQPIAHNIFDCTVKNISHVRTDILIQLQIAPNCQITAALNSDNALKLTLIPECPVTALVKASSIMLAQAETPPFISTKNRIRGSVVKYICKNSNYEIEVDIDNGMIITSVISCSEVEEYCFHPGKTVWVFFKTSDVVIISDR